MKILIFGTSKGKDEIENILDLNKVEIVGYLDNDPLKQNTLINNLVIYNPNEVLNLDFDYIVIASTAYRQAMINQLLDIGIERNRIIDKLPPKRQSGTRYIQDLAHQLSIEKSILKQEYIKKMDYFVVTQNQTMVPDDIDYYDFNDYLLKGIDFVRLSTAKLLANEIEERNINGSIAELGVYKGDYSKYLSRIFPDRKLFLFDTFEGFNSKDVELEKVNNYSNAIVGHLKDTNEEIVLSKVLNAENVEIIKGYFPESIPLNFKESFAFVSLDVDLYKPTYDGLKYFYENLNKGGYILIHDYNFEFYSGVKSAVREFCREENITPIPIADHHGSVIITK